MTEGNPKEDGRKSLLRNAWMVPYVARIARGFFEARPTVIEVALMQTFFPLVFLLVIQACTITTSRLFYPIVL